MEGVAWLTHKYIMHGLLWSLHEDHHVRNHHHTSFLQKNDAFFVVFAVPSILLFLAWHFYNVPHAAYIAAGIALYGLAYFIVHDIFIHQRIKWLRNTNIPYLKAIRKAHKVHHKHLTRHDGECFGMLWVPLKYFREARKMK
jgi:beta-carotene 3-hydroxylase